MKQIYLVVGGTGEYSDHTEWTVCAFINKARAEAHQEKCAFEAQKIFAEFGYPGANEHLRNNKQACDPEMHFDYTGTNYFVAGPITVED